MTFIESVSEDQATGAVAAMYETDRQTFGHVPNLTKAFSLRPDVYAAWRQLNGAIKANMDLRRTSSPRSPPRVVCGRATAVWRMGRSCSTGS
jgi:hypothetical protein